MMKSKAARKPPIYQLKITLDEVMPMVWRSFVADPLCTLPLLNLIVQAVMGWKNQHLHYFESQGLRYGLKDADLPDEYRDERRYRLGSLVKAVGHSFTYAYDFGDRWKHTITLERTLERSRSVVHPKCIDGKNACPPEDVGGPPGYRRLLLVLANPGLREYEELREWLGPAFEPSRFELRYQNLSMYNLRGTKLPWWARPS
jgi:hypothetical protein